MREMHLRVFAVAIAATLLLVTAYAQQSHWSSADDLTAKYIIEMERKWAEGVCVDNGVVAGLLADDFQGTSTIGARFTKADVENTTKLSQSGWLVEATLVHHTFAEAGRTAFPPSLTSCLKDFLP